MINQINWLKTSSGPKGYSVGQYFQRGVRRVSRYPRSQSNSKLHFQNTNRRCHVWGRETLCNMLLKKLLGATFNQPDNHLRLKVPTWQFCTREQRWEWKPCWLQGNLCKVKPLVHQCHLVRPPAIIANLQNWALVKAIPWLILLSLTSSAGSSISSTFRLALQSSRTLSRHCWSVE